MPVCLVCKQIDATPRHACDKCVTTTRRQIRDIHTYAKMLPALLRRSPGDGRRVPGFSSEPPARLEPIIALDSRSRSLALGRVGEVWDAECDDEDPTPSIRYVLAALAGLVREEQSTPEPTTKTTIDSEIAYLLGALDWCATREIIWDVGVEVNRLHRVVRSIAMDAPPGPIARCLKVGCEGRVFWSRDVPDPDNPGETLDAARCAESKCGRVYVGVDLIRLRVGGEIE